MAVLSQDEFFAKLTDLFRSHEGKDHGEIFLTQKRFTGNNTSSPSAPAAITSEPLEPAPILIRATDGQSKEDRASKVKISTLVQPDDLDIFYTRYAEVCRSGMTTLKPRDRTKRKKNKKKKVGGGGAGQTSMRAVE
ncbi:signal recognition particle, SRP9/SRP14 subunit [Coniochaeta ligniaria NRRL 30616]|uniref:Signal recognition particle subunit SRP14 n=1 Tax=Coniochaeta ligniaria NRRL 30616 TaxID=1408157 RepID=A0A1J7JC55_9PEZI|nr:signal recognition particle, SRP9/SRP14 subunit [Coniochaeta ligniaria NRRL 30616]